MWEGSTAICVNDEKKVLMVLQGIPDGPKYWVLPSGGKEEHETYEECCIRDVREETGYVVEIKKELFTKKSVQEGIKVNVRYFEVKVIDGELDVQDPDGYVYEAQWKSIEEIEKIMLGYPEDKDFILKYINKGQKC